MIKVKKSEKEPESLKLKKSYNGDDVKRQIREDQNDKCYICERKMDTDFEVEHLVSQSHEDELKFEWHNLLGACGYCNKRKSNRYDDLIDPVESDVERRIIQVVSMMNDKALFGMKDNLDERNSTIDLLENLYNGKNTQMGRNESEKYFWNYTKAELNDFQDKLNLYLKNPQDKNAQKVVKLELRKDKELLGFKYWMIRRNVNLYDKFKYDIKWNKD